MKKTRFIISLLLISALMFSLTGCNETKKAESAVSGMFSAFKKLDLKEAQKYIDVEELINSKDEDNENAEIIMKSIFKKLNYKMLSSEKIDDKTVIVKTKITAVDMKPVMGKVFEKAIEYAFSHAMSDDVSEDETTAEMEKILNECMSQPDLATVSEEVDIKVIKNKENVWKIKSDETFANAVLGGFIDAVKEINKTLESAE